MQRYRWLVRGVLKSLVFDRVYCLTNIQMYASSLLMLFQALVTLAVYSVALQIYAVDLATHVRCAVLPARYVRRDVRLYFLAARAFG